MKPKSKSFFENTYVLIIAAVLFLFIAFVAFQDMVFYFTKVKTEGRILKIVNERTGTQPVKATVSYYNQFQDHSEVSVIAVDRNFARTIYHDKVEPISYGKLFTDNIYFDGYKLPNAVTIGLEVAGLAVLVVVLSLSFKGIKKAGA